jgi:hypothetical protein
MCSEIDHYDFNVSAPADPWQGIQSDEDANACFY